MIRKAVKISWIPAPSAVVAAAASSAGEGPIVASLMALRPGSLEAIDHRSLGHAERQPVSNLALQRDVELRDALLLLLRNALLAIEPGLEGELAHQRQMLSAGAPETDIGFGLKAAPEVELAERQENLLDDAAIDQADALLAGTLQRRQSRQDAMERLHRRLVFVVGLAQAKLTIVRIEDPVAADLVLEGQDFRLELDPIVAVDLRAHVEGRRLRLVGMPELEDDLGVTLGEAIHIGDASSQNEG